LYGRSYYGNGTGTQSNRSDNTETSLIANENTGIIYKVGTQVAGTNEMPPPGYFKSVKGSGKSKLEPGQIKTSVLRTKQSYSLDRLCKYLFTGSADSKDFLHTGKFAFFGFEHLIKASAATPDILLAAEHNWSYSVTMKTKFKNITDIKIEDAEYVTL